MAPHLPWAEDMGMHSPLHQKLFDRAYTHHKRLAGPIARRTRSRTLKPPSHTPQLAPEAHPAHSGHFTQNPRPPSATALKKASRKLHITRLKLARSIDSERDDSGRLKPSLREKYYQLGLHGVLPPMLPNPRLASWDSEARMHRKAHPRRYPTRLYQVDKIWSEDELDEEFGLLSGEERGDGEAGLQAELDVEEYFTGVGRCVEDMLDGYCVGGVWRGLKEVERMRVEGWDCGFGGVIMDARCVEIIRGVRKGMGVV